MKLPSTNTSTLKTPVLNDRRGAARTVILALICVVIAGAAGWYYQAKRAGNSAGQESEKRVTDLSESSKTVLSRLNSTVEIHFYSLLDSASVPESEREFAGRVDELLSAYERNGDGKVVVTRHNSFSDAAANAASGDGIQAFNRDKGEACYFGIAVLNNGRKETLPRLSAEWEQALEPDLSRAIARLTAVIPPTQSVVSAAPNDAAAASELKEALPNLASVSAEEGTRLLRETALQEFKKTAEDMTAQVKDAEERLTAAQNGQSSAEQQAAMKNLQEVQSRHAEKLKEIAARLQSQIATLEQLKKQ